MHRYVDRLTRRQKAAALLAVDILLVPPCWFAALVLRLNDFTPRFWIANSVEGVIFATALSIAFAIGLRIHRIQLSTFGSTGVLRTAIWSIGVGITVFLANLFLPLGAPRTVPLIFGLLLLVSALGLRLVMRVWLDHSRRSHSDRKPVAIYGAGAGGVQLASALRRSKEYRPVLFIDDKPGLRGATIVGLRVVGPDSLSPLAAAGRFQSVFLAIPSLPPPARRRLLRTISEAKVEVLELPSYLEIIRAGGVMPAVRHVETDDLLNRPHVDLKSDRIGEAYRGETIMVTGAGGSIGSELCRRIVQVSPRRLVLFEVSEFALYNIARELEPLARERDIEIVSCLGSVQDIERIRQVIIEHGVTNIFHAAAYKHVPMVEDNVLEGAKNNILGTMLTAKAAGELSIERFILVSTDKAVRPTNVMGATKRMAEIAIQIQQALFPDTTYATVRFGNVIGSSGSVIPLFREQIEGGGPVTVTDPEVTRYFMSIPEAARLVMLAGAFAEGAEVFLLDMGEPVRIVDLARRMIELSGLTVRDDDTPDGDIEIQITGLRPGEKLYEELLIGTNSLPTPHPKILRAREDAPVPRNDLLDRIAETIAQGDRHGLIGLLVEYVDGYRLSEPCPRVTGPGLINHPDDPHRPDA
ncbi:polysaccharide biosynthesis protein [Notoacmeibacter ruber]|uniref:Polysaccharide biosynthesis protein n=1 Tax=Notoacmeibacter ruber TaxID=2670375 RepID=A0A3L7JIH1_9HYPH|nr:nucleoside-diphosphate sugar epimerase/dehydratase [Notoacmeibacter ruber]RLQ88282.1 polysaccharide biosynthesis protein [Notoacmeibacter ruber]